MLDEECYAEAGAATSVSRTDLEKLKAKNQESACSLGGCCKAGDARGTSGARTGSEAYAIFVVYGVSNVATNADLRLYIFTVPKRMPYDPNAEFLNAPFEMTRAAEEAIRVLVAENGLGRPWIEVQDQPHVGTAAEAMAWIDETWEINKRQLNGLTGEARFLLLDQSTGRVIRSERLSGASPRQPPSSGTAIPAF